MNKPTHSINAGLHQFFWAPEGVQVEVDRLRETREGVTGELQVSLVESGSQGHVHLSRVNLLSTTGRASVAKACDGRIRKDQRPDIDWHAVIEAACVKTVRAIRESTPPVLLDDIAEEGTEVRDLVPGLIRMNEINIFDADGGSGKSMLAMGMAVSVASGYPFLGHYPTESGAVLFLDWESDPNVQRRREARIKRGMGITERLPVYYQHCTVPLASDLESLQKFTIARNIRLILVDSLGLAVNGDVKDSPPILEFARALRTIQCTKFVVHHTNREEGYYGSVYIRNVARNMWEMKKQQTPGDNAITVGLYHRKSNDGTLLEALGIRMEFNDLANAVEFHETNLAEHHELAKKLPIAARITYLLRSGPISQADIADELEVNPETVRKTLTRMSGTKVEKLSGGGKDSIWQNVAGKV